MKTTALAALAAAFTLASAGAAAQQYPTRPVHIVVPVAPGLGVDIAARTIAQKMSEDLGQSMVVDNRAGANGMIGTGEVVRAAPDGYTILFATPSMVITSVYLNKTLPYDPKKDLAPISAVVEPVTSFVVHPGVPAKTVKEFIAWAKQNDGKVSYGSAGPGSVFHMVGELFNAAAGLNMLHVPYRSVPPAVRAVMTNEVQATFSALVSTMPLHRQGKLRILGVLEGERFSGMPEIPTVGESLPGFEKPASWFGFLAPAKTPPAVIRRIYQAVAKGCQVPDVRASFEKQAMAIICNTPAQFAQQIERGHEVYAKAIRLAGLKPQ